VCFVEHALAGVPAVTEHAVSRSERRTGTVTLSGGACLAVMPGKGYIDSWVPIYIMAGPTLACLHLGDSRPPA